MENVRISEILIRQIEDMIEKRYITKVKHPDMGLYILNYSKSCTLDHMWNEATEMCRGLIVDSEYNFVSRPFVKFYNDFEIANKDMIPNLPFEVYEKLDGSLGILYWEGDVPAIATRGSFSSDQALHATEILRTKYKDCFNKLDKSKTYLFEIIYPENHIVVNYGDKDDIILLAVIDTKTGKDCNLAEYFDLGFEVVKRYDGVTDYKVIKNTFDGTNKEGFVIKFSNDFRMKVKFDEYFRIHALISGVNKKNVLEWLINGEKDKFDELDRLLDEENRKMLHTMEEELISEYSRLYCLAVDKYNELGTFETDKEAAECYLNYPVFSAMFFKLRKGGDISPIIWKIIKKNIKCINHDEEN